MKRYYFLLMLLLPLYFFMAGCAKNNDADDEGDNSAPNYTITVADDGNGTASANMATAASGKTVTLTATPAVGYIFSEWSVESGDINLSSPVANPATFTMPSSDVSIRATFSEIPSGVHNMTVTWDNLELFDLSSVNLIDVITESGTEQCEFRNGQITISSIPSSIVGIRIYFSDNTASIYLDGNDFTFADGIIDITRVIPSGVVLVYDRATLEAVRDDLSGNFLQIRDIDLSGENWTPIGGSSNRPFTGSYDGGGYAIRNMTVDINDSGSVYAGLFGVNKGVGKLSNIRIEGGSVSGKSTNSIAYCGGVCGHNYYGTITECSNTGEVTGQASLSVYCGGVCGLNSGTVASCYNTGEVTGQSSAGAECGGVCGSNSGTLTSCHNTGSVSGYGSFARCGGVCGSNGGTITACYNSGEVIGETAGFATCGGVCGQNDPYSTIASCYNIGAVTGRSTNGLATCGGVCGRNFNKITLCNNTNSVSGYGASVYCGGVCGDGGGAITECHNTGSVSGEATGYDGRACCGGVCGDKGGMIAACYNTGEVSAQSAGSYNDAYCGGLCGYSNGGITVACYNTGNVKCKATDPTTYVYAYCGGICGYNYFYSAVIACYSAGAVSVEATGYDGRARCGGVCGENHYGAITYCYWRNQSASMSAAEYGDTIETMKFGDGDSNSGWPTATLPGWGAAAPDGWNATSFGAWTNPWSSLGGWNNGNPVYPTLKQTGSPTAGK